MDAPDTGILVPDISTASPRNTTRLGAMGCVLAMLLAAAASAQEPEPLVHLGVICLQEEPLASTFAQRLVAQGKPVFFVGDLTQGVSQGDLIRFKDKAVLIDADIWQTMQSMGILNKIKDIPVLTLTAKAKSEVWDSRSDQVSRSNENKGYTLGRELLKILEDYFGKTPSRMELVIRFNNGYMTLVAPRQLMSELNFVNVLRVQKTQEKPFFVTTEPPPRSFVSQEFSWTVWAVDPVEPAGQMQYAMTADAPPGLSWDASKHRLQGTLSGAGKFGLSFVAKNSRGQSVSMTCTLAVYENTAPRVHAKFDEMVVAGSTWEYAPFVADAEHTLEELEIRLFNNPPGMEFDRARGMIVWKVPGTLKDTTVQFVVGARDPLGAVTKTRASFQVVSNTATQRAITIDFRLPLDTLIQGHEYRWPDHVWMKAEWHEKSVRLSSIVGDDQTMYLASDGDDDGLLLIKPLRQGAHSMLFTFTFDTIQILVRKNCTVLPNKAPVFRSALHTPEYSRGQYVVYTPVVTDEDGDSLTLTVIDGNGVESSAAGDAVRLQTDKVGTTTLALTARDPYGNRTSQQIYYYVKPHAARRIAGYLQKTYRMAGDAGIEWGGLRFGLYSSDIGKTLTTGLLGLNTYESPFVFFGANPLGERQISLGNYLYVGGGVSFRVYSDRLYGGGILGWVQANYRADGVSPWRFQGFFTTRLKQALFIADTTGIREEFEGMLGDPGNILDGDLRYYVDKLLSVFSAYGMSDNFGLYLRLQTLYRLPAGLWLGPAAWLEDEVFRVPTEPEPGAEELTSSKLGGNFLVQYTGACLLHEWRFRWLEYSQQLHLGFRGDSFSPKAEWNVSLRAIRELR